MSKPIFRIDDIGASTKQFNQHGKKLFTCHGFPYFYFPLANFWFFKRIRPFKMWAKYKELTANEWIGVLKLFETNSIVPVIAITACWVDSKSNLISFPSKFPEQAKILKKAFRGGKIIIANHGLTHCVVGRHLPKFWGSNREFHREFWGWLPDDYHNQHVIDSQSILENYFEKPITVFVPPGNVWSIKTYRALSKTNIRTVMANNPMIDSHIQTYDVAYHNDKEDTKIHDRELKQYGIRWLADRIKQFKI